MMRNSFQNHHSQIFLHRPRYNLPDCLLEDQCRCNSMLLLPQWHLINGKVEPSWCSSHIQVYDARFQEYFLRVIVLHYSASTSSRLANLLNCPQRRFQMNSVVLNIETDLKKTIDCTNHPIFVPNLDLSIFSPNLDKHHNHIFRFSMPWKTKLSHGCGVAISDGRLFDPLFRMILGPHWINDRINYDNINIL